MRRRIINVILLVLVLGVTGIALYLNYAAQPAANQVQLPEDWPVPEITLPEGASNVMCQRDPFTGCYQLRFNSLISVSVNFSHFELPLLAAGYIKLSEPQTYNSRKLEMRFASADGKREILIRYYQRGGQITEQDWLIEVAPK